MADSVEKVGSDGGNMSADALSVEGTAQLCVSGWLHVWHRYQFRQLSEVLGGCCEEELVTGTFRPSQSQTIQLEDAFEVSEQHLDFLRSRREVRP